MTAAAPGSTINLTKERKEREAKAAMEAVQKAKPRATFSLFGLGASESDEGSPAKPQQSKTLSPKQPSKPEPASVRTAPRGVPSITGWRKNSDGSVTGKISGSPVFADGERVTTSPIVRGEIAKYEIVTTGSGSRYFLA